MLLSIFFLNKHVASDVDQALYVSLLMLYSFCSEVIKFNDMWKLAFIPRGLCTFLRYCYVAQVYNT